MMARFQTALSAALLLWCTGHAQAQALPAAPLPVQLPATVAQAESIRVQLVPLSSTMISSEIAGRVATLSLREGNRISQGQQLIGLDCDINRARLDKAQAQVAEFDKTLAVNRELSALGSVSDLELEVSETRLDAAKAEAALMGSMVRRCDIRAPFSGRVVKLEVRRHQYVAEGQPLVEILDDSNLEVEMVVPSRWLSRLKMGSRFQVHIDETNRRYDARVTRLGAKIDPVSQSIKIFGVISAPTGELISGMSGSAVFGGKP